MDFALIIYLVQLTGNLSDFFIIAMFMLGFGLTMYGIFACWAYGMPFHYKYLVIWLVCALFAVVIPSEKTAYAMLAAHTAEKVYDSPEAKQLMDKSIKALNIKLDEIITKK